MSRCYQLMYLWSLLGGGQAARSGLYLIDSERLQVCHSKREHPHPVFSVSARKGKRSTGGFYGFKLPLGINGRDGLLDDYCR